jgi:hypothetical protein
MGNTPAQEPREGESAGGRDSAGGGSLFARLGGLARRVAAGFRARVSVFSDLDLGAAFSAAAEERIDANGGEREEPRLPATAGRSTDSVSVTGLPARSRPFTEPARDEDGKNGTELRARKEEGQLSIYYPDRPETAITSDTWKRVER